VAKKGSIHDTVMLKVSCYVLIIKSVLKLYKNIILSFMDLFGI